MSTSDLLRIKGYIQLLPSLSGREDAPRVALVAEDGREIPVLHKGQGVGLIKNINANVEITGSLAPYVDNGEDEGDEPLQVLLVKSFHLRDGFDDPWYDDAVE